MVQVVCGAPNVRAGLKVIWLPPGSIVPASYGTKDGKERPIDCLIYGTGFVTDPRIYLKHFTCIGRNQIELKQAWKNGAESYYGIMTKNFPGLFQFNLIATNTCKMF